MQTYAHRSKTHVFVWPVQRWHNNNNKLDWQREEAPSEHYCVEGCQICYLPSSNTLFILTDRQVASLTSTCPSRVLVVSTYNVILQLALRLACQKLLGGNKCCKNFCQLPFWRISFFFNTFFILKIKKVIKKCYDDAFGRRPVLWITFKWGKK